MFRFLWLILSLAAWGMVLHLMPRMPPFVLLVPAGLSVVMYMFGLIIRRRNWLIHFFTGCLWTGVWFAYQGMGVFATQNLPVKIPPATIGKVLILITMILSAFLTFANYRISLNFIQRRGNIDRDMLGRLHGDKSVFEKIMRLFKRKKGIVLNLGKEVPFD